MFAFPPVLSAFFVLLSYFFSLPPTARVWRVGDHPGFSLPRKFRILFAVPPTRFAPVPSVRMAYRFGWSRSLPLTHLFRNCVMQ